MSAVLISLLVFVVIVAIIFWLVDYLPLGTAKLPVRVIVAALALIYVIVHYLPLLR